MKTNVLTIFCICLYNNFYNQFKKLKYISVGLGNNFFNSKFLRDNTKENIIFYSCTNYQHKKSEEGILWNDKDLNISWPTKNPIVSDKDKNNLSFQEYCRKFGI